MKRTAFATIIALALALPLAGCFEYSDGQRAGTVVKLSKRGFICKTWEGEMNLGGMRSKTDLITSGSGDSQTTTAVKSIVPNTWAFTVESEALARKIMAKMDAGETMTLTYREELVSFCRSDSASYFVTGIKN